MELKEIRKAMGLSLKKFSERYKIPLRTLENWEGGKNTPPDYVLELLEYKIKDDLILIEMANECAKDLKIDCPKIVFGMEKKTEGNLAMLVLDSKKNPKEIRISDNYEIIYDALFAICHEMRHVYQSKYMKGIFKDYAEIGEVDNEEYNLQEAEVDANAYAALTMKKYFGVVPEFKGFSEKVKAAIWDREARLERKNTMWE